MGRQRPRRAMRTLRPRRLSGPARHDQYVAEHEQHGSADRQSLIRVQNDDPMAPIRRPSAGTDSAAWRTPSRRVRLPCPDAPAFGAPICAAVTNRRLEATPGAPSGAHSGPVLTDYVDAGSKRLRPWRSGSVPHAQSELNTSTIARTSQLFNFWS